LIIVGNTAQYNGGGLFLRGGGDSPTLTNVIINGNSAGSQGGGGMYIEDYAPIMSNVDISSNTASGGGGLYVVQANPSLDHCNVWGNTPDGFVGMADPTGTDGNITADPRYMETTGDDSLTWDLHLGSASALVDAGSPSLVDPDGGQSDIGAYGGPEAAGWDLDGDDYYDWWLPGAYDPVTSPGMDCNDRDSSVYPGKGC
jgi:hypothetical protein